MMSVRGTVEPGRRFRSIETPHIVLRVLDVRPMTPVAHAHVVREDDPNSVLLLSVAVLTDKALYEPLEP